MNKVDLGASVGTAADLAISATSDHGVADLAREIRARIIRDEDLVSTGRWDRVAVDPIDS